MSHWSEMIRDPRMHCEEALRVPHRLESSHCPFSFAGGLVRVFRSVVQATRAVMSHVGDDIPRGGGVTGEFIGHDCAWHELHTLEQLSKEPLRGLRIAALLDQNIEYLSTLIDRAPQIDQLAVDLAEDFVEMPGIPRTAMSTTKTPRILGSELQTPESNG